MSGWTTCHDHQVDYVEDDGCPVCATAQEIARLRESNESLTRRLVHSMIPDPHGPQIHYLFGRPLSEIAKIVRDHDERERTANPASNLPYPTRSNCD